MSVFFNSGLAYNKNIMVGILLAGKALLKFPYVKRFMLLGEL